MLETGIKAPDFTLLDQNGQPRSLSDYRGQRVILYFYLLTALTGALLGMAHRCIRQRKGAL